MCAFGLADDCCHARLPRGLIAEANPRLDVFWLNRIGALTEGVVTELAFGDTGDGPPGPCEVNLRREGPNVWINETRVVIVWDEPIPGVGRPWFECPVCRQRCRHLYLRDTIACRRCHRLDYASRHLRRQMPTLGRAERLRRKLGDCSLQAFAPLPTRPRRGRARAYHDAMVARSLIRKPRSSAICRR